MTLKLPPALKGLITATLMVLMILRMYYTANDGTTGLQFIVYMIYAAGVVWAVLSYRFSPSFKGKFGDLFQRGFKCFIIVTLAMAIFYWVFNSRHPEFAAQSAQAYKEQLESLTGAEKKLPAEIESEVATYKKQYTLKLVSGAIFGYLIIGTGVTAVVSALLTRRK
jgi:hypothetical protein